MKFCGLGGRILRGSLMHINPLLEGGTKLFSGGGIHDPLPEALIVCTGISSRFLGGVEDKNVYPIRGQTVLIRAPWVRFGRTEYLDDSGACTYIIPRRSSDVSLSLIIRPPSSSSDFPARYRTTSARVTDYDLYPFTPSHI